MAIMLPMRPLNAFSLPGYDLKATYLGPVVTLGAVDVRYLGPNESSIESLVYFVPIDLPKATLVEIVRLARKACAPLPFAVNGRRADGTSIELWAADLSARLAKMHRTIADVWGLPEEIVAGL